MFDTIRDRLARDELVLAAGVGRLLHHNFIQMIGLHGGFHALWFDLEHVGFSIQELEVATITASSQGMDSFTRLAPTDYASVTRCYEAGSSGVMAAQIFSAAQAEEFVRWAKFAPRGHRGLNAGGWDGKYNMTPLADFCERANREHFVAIQIETAQAVEECDAIAAIDGVDLLFIGPADLSQNLGVTGDFWNQKCLDAIDRVAEGCKSHGKHWGAVTVSPEHADMLVEKGCKLISPTNDVRIVNVGVQAVKKSFAKYFV
jgi:4-hydroxy-2-oxoheptanedioate aldolase